MSNEKILEKVLHLLRQGKSVIVKVESKADYLHVTPVGNNCYTIRVMVNDTISDIGRNEDEKSLSKELDTIISWAAKEEQVGIYPAMTIKDMDTLIGDILIKGSSGKCSIVNENNGDMLEIKFENDSFFFAYDNRAFIDSNPMECTLRAIRFVFLLQRKEIRIS